MEIDTPIWNAEENAYTFHFTGDVQTIDTDVVVLNVAELKPPHFELTTMTFLDKLLDLFLDKTKRYFVSPLQKETVKKHLRHYIADVPTLPVSGTAYTPRFKPDYLKLKSNEFSLYWSVFEWKASIPQIRPDFFRSNSPAPQSPELQPNLRTIHIQNTMDTLVPVGDFPLSDLPPLDFVDDTPEKKEIRRRIREARLKVELAKLKAKRMEQKYYERYGEARAETEDSSLGSSDSDSDEHFGRYL